MDCALHAGPGCRHAAARQPGGGYLVEIRPTTDGRISRPGANGANVRMAICSRTPVRGWKCRLLYSTQTDMDGKFEFTSGSVFFPPQNMPFGEPAFSLVAFYHPEASQVHVVIPADSPNQAPVYAFDEELNPANGSNVRQFQGPAPFCKGIRFTIQSCD